MSQPQIKAFQVDTNDLGADPTMQTLLNPPVAGGITASVGNEQIYTSGVINTPQNTNVIFPDLYIPSGIISGSIRLNIDLYLTGENDSMDVDVLQNGVSIQNYLLFDDDPSWLGLTLDVSVSAGDYFSFGGYINNNNALDAEMGFSVSLTTWQELYPFEVRVV